MLPFDKKLSSYSSEYQTKWRQEHPESSRKSALKYYYKKKAENPEFHKNKTKRYRKANKDHVQKYMRNYDLQKEYNITLDKYNELLKQQNNSCGICGKSQNNFNKALGVDHCHRTNQVRGILCHQCNVSLGMFQDSVELLKNAITYLEKSHDTI